MFISSVTLTECYLCSWTWIKKNACGQNLTLTNSKFVLCGGIFLKIYWWAFYAFIWTGQYRVDRKERGRTTRQDSNSGRCERSCVVCRQTNQEAIGANHSAYFNVVKHYPISKSTAVNGPIVFTLIYIYIYIYAEICPFPIFFNRGTHWMHIYFPSFLMCFVRMPWASHAHGPLH